MSRAEELAQAIETRYRRGFETQEQANKRSLLECKEAAAELRRLGAENAQLRAELEAIYSTEPVAEITSWTNGSYWRNYKVNWIGQLDTGTKLIPLPVRKS